VRYWAWLNTVAKGAKSARIEGIYDPIMPDVAPFSYLIDLVADVGFRGVSWQDIQSWTDLTGIKLSSWEAKIIKRLSLLYEVSAKQYNDSIAPAPYRDIESEVSETLEQDIKAAIRN
tara:strand:- start:1166 stop:1516 length:351 start_codon:yes stop_codon:yes gene_type:complete